MAELLSKDALEIRSLTHHLEQEKLLNLNITQQLHLTQDRLQEFARTNEENQILYQRTVEYGKEIQTIKENASKAIERATALSGQYAETIFKLVEDKEQLLVDIEQLKNERSEDQKLFEKSSNESDEKLQRVEEEKKQVESNNTELLESIEQLKLSLNSTKIENEKINNTFDREKSELNKKIQDQNDSYTELKAILSQQEQENKKLNEELSTTKVSMEQIKLNFNQLNTAYKKTVGDKKEVKSTLQEKSVEYDKLKEDNEKFAVQVADLQRKLEEEIQSHSATTTKFNELTTSSTNDILKLKKLVTALKADRTKLQEENKQIDVLKQELSRSEQNERERSVELKILQTQYDNDLKELSITKDKFKALEDEYKEYKEKTSQDLAQTKHALSEEQTAKAAIDKELKSLKAAITKTRQSEVYLREQMTKLENKNSQLAKLNMDLNAKLVKMNNSGTTSTTKSPAGPSTGSSSRLTRENSMKKSVESVKPQNGSATPEGVTSLSDSKSE